MTVTLLERRRIEAEILAPTHAAIARRWGTEAADELLAEVIDAQAFAAGQALRRERPDGSLVSFAAIWERFAEGGALEFDLIERGPHRLHVRVTRCRYAEFYAERGLGGLGFTLSCRRDRALARGYSDRIRFDRPSTLQEGGRCCEFIFTEQAP
jgi:hypothetical protein